MPTNLYVPHSMNFASGTDLTQLDALDIDMGMEGFRVHSASEVLPGFSGNMFARPMLAMQTTQIKDILDKTTTDNVVTGYSSANIDLEYRIITNLTGRTAIATTSHCRARATHSLLSWDSIQAPLGSLATINFRWLPISDGTNAPLVYTNSVAITGTSAVQAVFECGPVALNGSTLCTQGWTWNNNMSYFERRCGGSAYLEFAAVDRCAPTIEIEVEDITTALALLPGGAALSSLSVYLRKKAASVLNVANATEEHILLSASVGSVRPLSPKRIQVEVHSFSVDTTSAIS